MKLAERLAGGDVRAVARAISLVEQDSTAAVELLRAIFPSTGRATVVGLTGAPGAGKSSLVDRLVAVLRTAGRRVGVIAVDPSSAYSGGAILGDRVRMQSHATDPDVFIRSMATRGHLGGLARATNDAIDVLDAAGYDPILVETVGVGQDEVEVVKTADVVAVILIPGMGDDIQAIKAGILEIADLFLINKSDHPGADRLHAELDAMLGLVEWTDRSRPTIHRTVAVRNEGIAEAHAAIEEFLETTARQRRHERRRERAEARFLAVLGERLMRHVMDRGLSEEGVAGVVEEIADRRTDPYTAVERILARVEVG
jgi:LAO/AO transport system kinase